MTRTELIYQSNGDFGNYSVQIDGLIPLLDMLGNAEDESYMRNVLVKAIGDVAREKVLPEAKRRASAIADDGTFSSSLSIAQRGKGAKYVLKSTDPQAAVKEFAHIGAKTVSSKGTQLANTRLLLRSGVGVPKGNPPRAMIPAVDNNIDEVREGIELAIAKVLEVRNGQSVSNN